MRLLLVLACCLCIAGVTSPASAVDEKPGWIPEELPPAVAGGGCDDLAPSDQCDAGGASLGTNPMTVVGWDTANLAADYNPGPANACTGYSASGPDGAYYVEVGAECTISLSLDSDPPDVPGSQGWDRSLYFVSDCADIVGTCLCGSDATFPGGAQGPEACMYTNNTGGTVSGFVVVDGFASSSFGPYCLTASTDCPPVPVEERSWGSVKAQYR